jgi:hypothetical protein
MRRFCPTCGTVHLADEIDLGRAVTTCRACGSATTVHPSGPEAVRRRPKVLRPRHFSVRDDGTSLRIRYRWVWRKFTGPATMCLGWNSFVAAWYWLAIRAGDRGMWLAIFICIPHLAVGLFLVYATLAGLLNRTVIRATSESVRVWNGPVPWWGNRTLAVDQLEELSCNKGWDGQEGRERSDYVVTARVKGGSQVELVTDLYDPTQARFIRQELERWLKAGARGGGATPILGGP